jgi:tryptophan halogenase
MDIPETLQRRIELFRGAGRLFRYEDELFAEPNWLAVLTGQNILPQTYDPLVDAIELDAARAALQRIRTIFRQTAEAMPTHRAFIARHCAAPPARAPAAAEAGP